MTLRRRQRERQGRFCEAEDKVGNEPSYALNDRLNELVAASEFDPKLKVAARPHDAATGRQG